MRYWNEITDDNYDCYSKKNICEVTGGVAIPRQSPESFLRVVYMFFLLYPVKHPTSLFTADLKTHFFLRLSVKCKKLQLLFCTNDLKASSYISHGLMCLNSQIT